MNNFLRSKKKMYISKNFKLNNLLKNAHEYNEIKS